LLEGGKKDANKVGEAPTTLRTTPLLVYWVVQLIEAYLEAQQSYRTSPAASATLVDPELQAAPTAPEALLDNAATTADTTPIAPPGAAKKQVHITSS
jgi:hypothetical protein